jgi:hypothetical protein
MPLSTWAGNAILDALLNNAALAESPYISLHSGDPGLDGANELSGNNYGRILGSFGAASSQAAANDALVTFATASGDWAQATYFGVSDAVSAGNFVGGAALDDARTILSGEYGEFAISALDVTAATQFGDDTLDDIIDALFNATSLQVAQAYASLHTGDPGGTGANEMPDAESYARVALPFGAAAAKACASDTETDFAAAGGDGWAESTHLGLWTSITYGAGTFLWGKALTAARTVGVGKVFRMAVGDVDVTIT